MLAVWAAALPVALAGYLESDYGEQRTTVQPRPEPRPIPPPAPPPRLDNPTTRLVRDVRVGEPIRWGRLVLFPVILPGAEPVATIHPLGRAMDRGWVTIEEAKPASVGRAVLVNQSDHLVLVLAGELIKGGQQNRSSQNDLLLPPHRRVPIDLYCIEQGRWTALPGGAGSRLEAAKALAPQSVRAGNVAGAGQDRVWEDIRSFNEAAGARAPSQDLLAGLDSDKVQAELKEARRECIPRLPARVVGLIAGRAGRIFAADLFVDEDLFAAYRHMIIDSYATEEVYFKLRPRADPPAGDEPAARPDRGLIPIPRPIPVPPPPDRDAAREFLDRVLRAHFAAIATPGGGDLWRISGTATGQALDYRGQSVHVALTSQRIIPIVRPPVPVPLPRPMPMPRDRRDVE